MRLDLRTCSSTSIIGYYDLVPSRLALDLTAAGADAAIGEQVEMVRMAGEGE